MEKIKITVEQEKALKDFKNEMEKDGLNPLVYRAEGELVINEWKAINHFELEELALLLLGYYEVEETFKVGDWVFEKMAGCYRKVHEKRLTNKEVNIGTVLEYKGLFEKVTEDWKIMLLELGREKPELKVGDIIITSYGGTITVDELNIEVAYEEFENHGEYLYSIESRIKLK